MFLKFGKFDARVSSSLKYTGRSIKAMYEHGWHFGTVSVMYWNNIFGEFKINFPDGLIDYINPNDIDNVEITWNQVYLY